MRKEKAGFLKRYQGCKRWRDTEGEKKATKIPKIMKQTWQTNTMWNPGPEKSIGREAD